MRTMTHTPHCLDRLRASHQRAVEAKTDSNQIQQLKGTDPVADTFSSDWLRPFDVGEARSVANKQSPRYAVQQQGRIERLSYDFLIASYLAHPLTYLAAT